jgi:5-bromo-4-chloroindolyl phosphate hydrolysis protein
MDYLLGAGFGTLIILSIAIPRHILWCRREDRRGALLLRMKDNARAQELRMTGWSEEQVNYYREQLKSARKEVGLWNKWDEEAERRLGNS